MKNSKNTPVEEVVFNSLKKTTTPSKHWSETMPTEKRPMVIRESVNQDNIPSHFTNTERKDFWSWEFKYNRMSCQMQGMLVEMGSGCTWWNINIYSNCEGTWVREMSLMTLTRGQAWKERKDLMRNHYVVKRIEEVEVIEKKEKAPVKGVTLTPKQEMVLKTAWESSLDMAGGDFTFSDELSEALNALGMSKRTFAGVFGTLVQKGMVWSADVDHSTEFTQIGVTELGREFLGV